MTYSKPYATYSQKPYTDMNTHAPRPEHAVSHGRMCARRSNVIHPPPQCACCPSSVPCDTHTWRYSAGHGTWGCARPPRTR